MSDEPTGANEQSLIVNQLIAEFMSRSDAGEDLDVTQFLCEHPEHAAELEKHFANVDLLDGLKETGQPRHEETILKPDADSERSTDDATANTIVRGGTDSETSVTRDFERRDTEKTEVAIPENFGRYAIQKVLGQGAMGAVYLARDTQLDRDVALKIPKFGDGNGVDDEELLERFYREARASATLRSPNICPVYDVGEIDGQHYITMAFIEGRPLKDFTKSKKKHSEKQIVTTIRKLAVGLAEAHEIGVIHRDLKPANIMVDLKGEPVVMDFGLARRSASDDVQVTQSGAILGTPAYMAPEQVAGDQAAINHQVDIYALGIIMYELITGEMPFKGNLMAILQQIALNKPTKPSDLRKDIDPRLETICLKMMAGDQTRRYQSTNDVASDLQEVLRNPGKRQKKEESKKTGPKPTSIPSANEESNPALISVAQPKSYAEQLRKKKGRSSSKSPKSSTKLPVTSPSDGNKDNKKKYLIAGGLGGLILLLGIVFLVRVGKYEVQITLDDPGITMSVDGNKLVIKDIEKQVIKLSAGEHKLKLEKDGLTTHVEEFTVSKNGRTTLHAVVVNEELDVLINGEEKPTAGSKKPQTDQPSKYALYFNGEESRIEIPDAPFSFDSPFTIEINVDTEETFLEAQKWQTVFYRGALGLVYDSARSGWILQVSSGRGVVYMCKMNGVTEPGEAAKIAITWDMQKLKMYVDGQEAPDVQLKLASSSLSEVLLDALPPNKWVTGIGARAQPNFSAVPFQGKLYNLRISNIARFQGSLQSPSIIKDAATELLYRIDEGEGNFLLDSSGNGQDGQIIGAKWVRIDDGPGTIEEASPLIQSSHESGLLFDSKDSRVEVGQLPIDLKKPITIELWCYVRDEVVPNKEISNIAVSLGPFQIQRYLFTEKKEFEWQVRTEPSFGVRSGLGGVTHIVARDTPDPEERHHIAVQLNGAKVQFFLNGKPMPLIRRSWKGKDGEDPDVQFREIVAAFPDLNLIIGSGSQAERGFSEKNYNGIIRQLSISNELKFVGPFVPKEPHEIIPDENTIALYRFDEGSGETLNDSSGNGHHGKIIGAKWVNADTLKATTDTSSSENAPPPAVVPFDTAAAKAHQEAWARHLDVPVEKDVELPGGEKMVFVLIPPGEFTMGSTREEQDRFRDGVGDSPWAEDWLRSEGPQHRVRITRPFYIGKYEVTNAQWQGLGGEAAAGSTGSPTHPVIGLNWSNIQRHISEAQTLAPQGTSFALPTEAQWEYACRAGSTTAWYFGDDEERLQEYVWYADNSKLQLQPVGKLLPNGFGLHDMLGNAIEHCSDSMNIDFYTRSPVEDPEDSNDNHTSVQRGGSQRMTPALTRSAARFSQSRSGIRGGSGFRLVLSIEAAKASSNFAPPAAIAPFDEAAAKAHQEAWADYLGVPVEFTNSLGM